MSRMAILALIVAAVGLGACGQTTQERALSGAGLGAAGGLAAGTLTDNPLGGALLGGAAGAAVGGLTEEEDIDLGEPIWNRF